MVRRFLWIAIALLMTSGLSADELKVKAVLDKSTIKLGQSVVLDLHISGEGNLSKMAVTLPKLEENFSVLSSSESTSYTLINGSLSSTRTMRYILSPFRKGILKIPAITITVGDKRFKTATLTLQVLPSTGDGMHHVSRPLIGKSGKKYAQESFGKQVFLKSTLSRSKVYIGEGLIYSLKLYRRIHIWRNISMESPMLTNFWTEKMTPKPDAIQNINGQRYYVLELLRYAIYPIAAGKLDIGPARVSYHLTPFDRIKVLETPPLYLAVRPLPENKPSDFFGAIGSYKLSAKSDKKVLERGKPLTLTVRLSGRGNLKAIRKLALSENETVTIYDSKIEDIYDDKKEKIVYRQFSYVIIPNKVGVQPLPQVSLSYFSPQKKSYEKIETEAKEIEVIDSKDIEPSPQTQVKSEGKGSPKKALRPLKPMPSITSGAALHEKKWFLAVFGINLGILVLFLAFPFRTRLRFSNGKKKKNRKKQYSKLKKKLSLGIKENSNVALETILQGFHDYLSAVLSKPSQGLPQKERRRLSLEEGLYEDDIIKIEELLLDFESYVYSAHLMKKESIKESYIRLKDLIESMEKGR